MLIRVIALCHESSGVAVTLTSQCELPYETLDDDWRRTEVGFDANHIHGDHAPVYGFKHVTWCDMTIICDIADQAQQYVDPPGSWSCLIIRFVWVTPWFKDPAPFRSPVGNRWYRINGAAGNAMALRSPGKEHCGTTSPGWLSSWNPSDGDPPEDYAVPGTYPAAAQGVVSMTVW